MMIKFMYPYIQCQLLFSYTKLLLFMILVCYFPVFYKDSINYHKVSVEVNCCDRKVNGLKKG